MGNRRFRFSHMIPTFWFFKLREMVKGKTTIKESPNSSSQPFWSSSSSSTISSSSLSAPSPNLLPAYRRKSYYFTRISDKKSILQPPRRSVKRRRSRSRRYVTSFPSKGFRRSPESVNSSTSPLFSDTLGAVKACEFNRCLRPIVTKRNYFPGSVPKVSGEKENSVRRIPAMSGVKLRPYSPRIGTCSSSRRGVAVVKCSRDPRRDFRESMVEMIVENKLKESKELEELLGCYLSLNPDEYHDLIISVFKQLWMDVIAPPRQC